MYRLRFERRSSWIQISTVTATRASVYPVTGDDFSHIMRVYWWHVLNTWLERYINAVTLPASPVLDWPHLAPQYHGCRPERGLQSQQDIFFYIFYFPPSDFALHLCLGPIPSFCVSPNYWIMDRVLTADMKYNKCWEREETNWRRVMRWIWEEELRRTEHCHGSTITLITTPPQI